MTRWISLAIILCALIIGIILTATFQSKNAINPERISQAQTLPNNIDTWYEYTEPEGNFKVLLPGLPHHAIEQNAEFATKEMRRHELFAANKGDGTLFSILMITFPQKKKEELNSDFLMSFITEMLKSNKDNKIQFMKSVTYNNLHAIDFSVENQDAMIDGKAFFKDNTLYMLSRTAKMNNRSNKEFDLFVNSFQLGIPQPKPALGQQQNKVSK